MIIPVVVLFRKADSLEKLKLPVNITLAPVVVTAVIRELVADKISDMSPN